MNNKSKENMSFEDKIIADSVADQILTVDTKKQDKRYLILLLIFLVCLIFLVSSISFAVFDTYFNGSTDNAIEVGIDIGVDDKDTDKDKVNDDDKDSNYNDSEKSEEFTDNSTSVSDDSNGDNLDDEDKPIEIPDIDQSSVLFTFNEGSNYVNMINVFPLSDEEGMNLTGNMQFFDFNVATKFSPDSKGSLVYEVSLVPISGNTISSSDVRVYLTENGKGVSILNNAINNISSLPNSKYREGAKVLFRKNIKDDYIANYEFRMWLSDKANIGEKVKRYGCKIVVDAYYE